MNKGVINKIVKAFLFLLLASIVLIFALYWNIGRDFSKQVESGQVEPISGEGLGILGYLLYFFIFYTILFVIWLSILNSKKKEVSYNSKRNQLAVIFIFSILPASLIVIFLILASPKPFKQYQYVKRLEHEIENGQIIKYSNDSVKIYEATIVNDKIVGKEITRYSNGRISSEKNYKEGLLDGESIDYYENGNKKGVTLYSLGMTKRIVSFYENGQMSCLHDKDSLYDRYDWWENGQMQSRNYNGNTSDYWEQDGKQTLFRANGKIAIWAKEKDKKEREIMYKNAKIMKETSWYNSGFIIYQREFIILNEKEAEEIGCEDGEFRGYKSVLYYENGKTRTIDYSGKGHKGKGYYKRIEYDENGNALKS